MKNGTRVWVARDGSDSGWREKLVSPDMEVQEGGWTGAWSVEKDLADFPPPVSAGTGFSRYRDAYDRKNAN